MLMSEMVKCIIKTAKMWHANSIISHTATNAKQQELSEMIICTVVTAGNT